MAAGFSTEVEKDVAHLLLLMAAGRDRTTTVEAAVGQPGSGPAPRSGISARTACPAGGSSR